MVEGFDVGNFFVIPGTPAKAWEADIVTALHKDNLRVRSEERRVGKEC